MAVPVAGNAARPIDILLMRLRPRPQARPGERRLELALDHRLDELAHPVAQPALDRIKPVVEKINRAPLPTAGTAIACYCYCWSWRGFHRWANAGIVRVSTPGDYATFNSNHLPDGTLEHRQRLTRSDPVVGARGMINSANEDAFGSPETRSTLPLATSVDASIARRSARLICRAFATRSARPRGPRSQSRRRSGRPRRRRRPPRRG